MDCSQLDLNIGYGDFLSGHGLNPRERGKYYSASIPFEGDGIFPYLPYGNDTNSSFYFCERLLSSGYLWRYLEDEQENTFLRFFRERGVLEELEEKGIGLFGISVISPSQAVASLTLGLLVKKTHPSVHVTIGGQWVTLYREVLAGKKELFRCFDSLVVFEGESALLGLAKRLDAGQPVAPVVAGSDEDMDSLPCPDFDGLPLADYNGAADGEICLTYETSRGCYWAKCAYCVDLPLPKPSYRRKDPASVVRDMEELSRKYGAGYLLLGDPGLSPRQMREISLRKLKERVPVAWWTMARLDPGFDRELFGLARAAGLRQVNFGFESACDRVCGLLDKGNRRELSARVIRDCAQAGVRVDLQTMLGLPGESFEDGLETIDFLVANRESISEVTFNTYYLTPANHVYRNPSKYGIEYDDPGDLPFRFFFPFRNTRGMDVEKAWMLEKIYRSLMRAG
jgi:radical SAM superfamily enzyme YgiQ (UPF0313 family)